MIIVSDTTPILYLIKIDEIELLKDLFNEVHIPRAVYNELTSNNNYVNEINKLNSLEFIIVDDIVDIRIVEDLMSKNTNIHRGEAESIILCKTLDSNLILMEDNAGIRVAKSMGIKVIRLGTLFIELNNKKIRTRDEIITIINKLKQTKIKMYSELYDYILGKLNWNG